MFSCENTQESELRSGGEAEARGRVCEVAELALGRLGMGARERRARLKEVLERAGERAWSEAELVRAVLSAA